MASTRFETGKKFLEAFAKLDKNTLLSMITPDFTYTQGPTSLRLTPAVDAAEYGQTLDEAWTLLRGYTLSIKKTIDCGDTENKAMFWSTMKVHFRPEVMDDWISEDDWKHTSESMTILTFAEDGKIKEQFEFLDSRAVERVFPLTLRAQRNARLIPKEMRR